ncbi:MAG: hypothetical protein RIC82_03720 [Parvibaculum sp.]
MKRTAPNFTTKPLKADRSPVTAGDAQTLDILDGRAKGDIYNARAVKLATGQWLVRIGVAPFRLFQDFGGTWFDVMTLAPDDPAIADLEQHMTVYGPSPSQRALEQKHAEDRARREQGEQAQKEGRRSYWQRLADMRKQQQAKARDEARNRIGVT